MIAWTLQAQIVLQKIHGKCDYETEMSSIQSAQISYKVTYGFIYHIFFLWRRQMEPISVTTK